MLLYLFYNMEKIKYIPVIQTAINLYIFLATYLLIFTILITKNKNLCFIQIVSTIISCYLYTFLFIDQYGNNYLLSILN